MCFFFFKQKTAYEMRISDWSSDVCSSDLFLDLLAGAAAPAALFSLGASLVEFRIRGALRQSLSVVALKLVVHPLLVWLLAAFVLRLPPLWEIGRASCRERVC